MFVEQATCVAISLAMLSEGARIESNNKIMAMTTGLDESKGFQHGTPPDSRWFCLATARLG
jgi:hypothetical protein